MDLSSLIGAGPVWALLAVIATQAANVWMNQRKVDGDTNSAAMAALNAGHKQLVDGLFQQVKALSDQVDVLRAQLKLADTHYREAMDRIKALEAGVISAQLHANALTLTIPHPPPPPPGESKAPIRLHPPTPKESPC